MVFQIWSKHLNVIVQMTNAWCGCEEETVPHASGLEAQLLSGSAHLKYRINLQQEMDRILFLLIDSDANFELKIKLHKGLKKKTY